MNKVTLSTRISTFPMPAAVITVGKWEEANLITLAYVGRVCMSPSIISISIQPKRHSYHLIENHGEFVINYPTIDQLKAMDYCGTRSGRNVNKWEELNLTKGKSSKVDVPLIQEFPLNMECKVVNRIELGSHVCYFGEVLAAHSNPELVSNNNLDPEKMSIFAYLNGSYVKLENKILEKHGFSLK